MINSLDNVFAEINNTYSNINYTKDEERSNDEMIRFYTHVVSDHFKGEATVTGRIANSGFINLYFTFGEIEETPEALARINEFNLFATMAKAYIGEIAGKKHLEIRYNNSMEIDDGQAPRLYRFFFDNAVGEDLSEHLKALVDLTK